MAITALGLMLAGGLALFSGLMVMGIVWPMIYGILKRMISPSPQPSPSRGEGV